MLATGRNQSEGGCLQVAARSASRTFCSAKPAGGLRHMQTARKFVSTYSYRHYKDRADEIREEVLK